MTEKIIMEILNCFIINFEKLYKCKLRESFILISWVFFVYNLRI